MTYTNINDDLLLFEKANVHFSDLGLLWCMGVLKIIRFAHSLAVMRMEVNVAEEQQKEFKLKHSQIG